MIGKLKVLIKYGREKAQADGIMLGLILVFCIILENLDIYVRRLDSRRRKMPSILINTVPKSGSMFIQNSLEVRCGLHSVITGDHGFPYAPLHDLKLKKFAIGCAIDQGHYMPSVKNLTLLKKYCINKIVVHFRDPRQVLVSWVYYADKYNETHNLFAFEDIDIPLDYFGKLFEKKMDIMIDLYYPHFVGFIDSWLSYKRDGVQKWGIEVLITEFRKMKNEPDSFFDEICAFYGIDQFGSHRLNIDSAAAHSHDRKGELEEWRQVLTPDQIMRTSLMITDEMAQRFGWSIQ